MTAREQLLESVAAASLAAELIVLFGSHARGDARPQSDVDVAVRWREESSEAERLEASNALERAVGRAIDLVDLASAPPQLRFEIARDGVLLFERVQGMWTELRARAQIDWWDFRPVARIMHEGAMRRLRASHGSR